LEQNYIIMLIFASSWIFSYWLNMLPFGKDLKEYRRAGGPLALTKTLGGCHPGWVRSAGVALTSAVPRVWC